MRAMKDSGIEWIGNIPQKWNIQRGKYTFSVLSGFAFPSSDFSTSEGIPLIRIRDITSGVTETFFKGEYSEEFMVDDGDLLIGMDGDFGIRVWDNGQALLNQRCCKIIANKDNSLKYLFYVLPYELKRINDLAFFTTVKHLSTEDLALVNIPLPSGEEQQRIADYLDAKCSEIDALIAAKEKTNALLKERRQSIIYEAVTKGLNPDAPMKDSGIEWIGQIPERWSVWRMKHLASEPLQYGANATGVEFRDDIPRYVRITDITADRKLSDEGKQSLETDVAQDYMLEDGDILFARSGATSGKSFYYESEYGPCCFAGYLIKLRTDKSKALSKFLYYYTLTQAYENWTQQIFIQATIQNISADKYNNLWFSLPETLEEQADIVAYLDQRCSEMDALISANEVTIQKLKEYRQSIIYEAVTGKIEV